MLQLHETGNVDVITNVGVGITLVESFYPLCGDAVETSVITEDTVAGSFIMGTAKVRPDSYTKHVELYPKHLSSGQSKGET